MKEEDILLKKLGKEDSFKVPDGYFENLTSEVMNKLPEKEKVVFKEEPVSTWTRLKPLLYIDRKSTRLNSSHTQKSRMPSSA